jgi:phosphoribosylaminoimidazole-succinocarboxamide synthase
VSLDRPDLEQLCQQTLAETDFKRLGSRFVGKVRVSCFELVVGTIPLKGQILNQMAAFWFEQTREVEEPR